MRNFLKVFAILNKSERIYFIFIILFAFLNAILDLISIASIYPLSMSVLNIDSTSAFIEKINLFIRENLNFNLTIFYLFAIFLIFTTKNIFNIFFLISLNHFLMKKFNDNAKQTIQSQLNLEFVNFASINFPEFHANIINQNNNLKSYILSLVTLLSETLVLFSIATIMLIIDHKTTLIICTFFLIFILIYLILFKKKIKIWGYKKHNIYKGINKTLLEIYNSIRDIKILDKEIFFVNKFHKQNSDYSLIDFKYETLVAINRNIIELLILLVIIIALISLGLSSSIYNLIPVLSIYLVAFFRVYPSINKIMNNLATIKFYKVGLDYFYNERIKFNPHKIYQSKNFPKLNFFHQIELKNVSFRYDKSKKFLLENINIIINKGEIVGVIGDNGSGKSTLCNLLLGLLKPEKGSIIIDDKINIHDNYHGYKKNLSFVPQKIYLINDTIKNNIMFGSENDEIKNFNINKVKILSQLLAFNLKDNSDDIFDYEIGEDGSKLSGGQKQRIAIARALYKDTEILIMDEPNNNLDSQIEIKIMEDLVNLSTNKTIIIITHNPETLKHCNKVIEINNNQVKIVK